MTTLHAAGDPLVAPHGAREAGNVERAGPSWNRAAAGVRAPSQR